MRVLTSALVALSMTTGLVGCGVIYHSPGVRQGTTEAGKVRVMEITPETVLLANRSPYQPRTLPAVFEQTAGLGSGLRGTGAVPEPAIDPTLRPEKLATRLPPEVEATPYRIGVSDVLVLATPQNGSTVAELTGLLAAQNARQGYTVQDDGSIAIPNVGRVQVAGMTLEEAEAALFQRLVENQIDPTFSLEISEFNSKKVAVGGAVSNPTVVPVTLSPVYLDEALAKAGGITVADLDYASVRIYRNGSLYQVPLKELYSNSKLQRIQLVSGDSVFVDTTYDLDLAKAYFAEQIELANFRQSARQAALTALSSEVALRREALSEARSNYQAQETLGAVDRDYVYLTGEIGKQSRFTLPYTQKATLADALYSQGGGFTTTVADVRQIYVLRASDDPREFGAVTAWQLNAQNAANLTLATKFELRPDDIVFIAEQPVTRWNRTLGQIVPSLSAINTGANIND